jgi:hypothetical protein
LVHEYMILKRNLEMRKWGILVFILFFSLKLSAYSFTMIPTTLSVNDKVWFATSSGLYRYDKVQDEWVIFSTGNGLAGNNIRDIGVDEGVIWVATDGGVSNSDLRFSDWRSYAVTDGLPDNNVRCLAFSEDYIWVGTDQGVGRFDKLLEEWKVYTESDGLAGQQVNDIASDTDTVWFATSNGISKLDVDFNKWTSYSEPDLPSINVIRIIIMGDYIWFVADKGLVRYDKKLRSWRTYGLADGIISFQVNNVVTTGDSIWLATSDGISIYDSTSDSWSPGIVYHSMLPSKNIKDLAFDGDFIWFCTDKGVSTFDKGTGSWRYYNTSDGLLDELCQCVIISDKVFVMTEKGINLYDKSTQDWEVYEFSKVAADKTGDKGFRLNKGGVSYDFSKDGNVRLSGFSSLEFLNNSQFNDKVENDYNWDLTNDLSFRGAIPVKRSIVGFYNDLIENNPEYGMTYRGNESDILQEATAGEFEAELRNSEFIEDINLLGAGARFKKGINTAKLSMEPRYGQQRGYFETDFFTYKTGTDIYTLSHINIIPETDEVVVKNEKLKRGFDYLIVYTSGWLVFYREELVEEGEEIEIRYQYEANDTLDTTPDPAYQGESGKNLAILTTGVDINDNYYAGFDVLHGENSDVISFNGDGKNISMGPMSMRLRPEFAYSRQSMDGENTDGIASRGEVLLNVPRTRLKFDYEDYGQDFWTPGRRETRFGELDRHFGIFSQFDIAQWMPLTVLWQKDRSYNIDKEEFFEEDAMVNLVFSKSPYPTLALAGERNEVKEETKNSLRGDFQYSIPDYILSYIRFRKGEVKGYYKESWGQEKIQTGYAKMQLSPMERFVLNSSFKLNRTYKKSELQDELRRWLVRWDFSTFDGIISNLYLDDLRAKSITAEDKDRYLSASLNVIPGAWTRKLEMITLSGRYSFIQQMVPVSSDSSEEDKEKYADSNSRSLRLQTNLRPHNTILCTGTYDRTKSWVEDIPPIKNSQSFRYEAEFKPVSKSRIVLEYLQEYDDEDAKIQKRSYSPSIWWENRWSQRWTTRLRNIYQYQNTRESGEIKETGSTLTPSLSFRYNTRELPHNGRLYVTQSLSVSVYRGERDERDLASDTYSASLVLDWKITGNFSFRLRGSVSYEDNHSSGGSDKKANIYIRVLIKF